jgi:hypothetical protein
VRKLDKLRFFEGKPGGDGHKPLYADIVLVARKEVGKFGDTHIVKQSKKKDEQIDMPIIGSATERVFECASPVPRIAPKTADSIEEDCPF